MTGTHPHTFIRDRFTLLAYAMLGYFAYLQAAPGVAMPLLREDLDLSYTLGGLHVSTFALGMVLAGLSSDRAAARWGRPAVFWGGGAGMAVGALLLAAGRHPAITIGGMGIMGVFGTALLAAIQSSLADRHGAQRAIALTESNVVAAASTVLPPLLIGGFERAGWGWELAFVVMVLLWGVMFLTLRREPVPAALNEEHGASGDAPGQRERNAEQPTPRGPLPRVFWVYWVALVFCVAVEWSIIAWGADFLTEAANMPNADASLIMTLFFLAMMIGRAGGSTLARHADLIKLLFSAMLTGLAGFALFWLVPVTVLRVPGLFIAGLGVANLFPFLLSISLSAAAQHADTASSRITLGSGLAILVAPQVLGTTADLTGIQIAYGLVFALFVLAFAVVIVARRRQVAIGE